MEGDKGESNGSGGGETATEKKKKTVPKEEAEEALKKCLKENKGDHIKCKAKIEAFLSSSSTSQNPPPPPRQSIGPFRRKRGSLTDV